MKIKKHLRVMIVIIALCMVAASCINSSQLSISGGKQPLFITFGVI